MALVDYSGSESSGEEDKFITQQAVTRPKTTSSKSAFQRVVDRSDPHKIRVSLPEVLKPTSDDEDVERPTKRAKIGSGGLSGFNALLPAPKRAAAVNGRASLGGPRAGGLGSGINLKTGAAPGFSREPEQSLPAVGEGQIDGNTAETSGGAQDGMPESPDGLSPAVMDKKTLEEPKPRSKSTIFKPLSVARRPQKKKVKPTGHGNAIAEATHAPREDKLKPKLSLFSTGGVSQRSREEYVRKGEYQPMVYHTDTVDAKLSSIDLPGDLEGESSFAIATESIATDPTPQSLDSIASDLNLSKSAKRQLIGRQKTNGSAVNIVNFNIDEEYKANEDIRRSGEQVQHNAVRSIAPGKHSLKQLVNMGTVQAEALEESFASGRRNRSEAGSKYGW